MKINRIISFTLLSLVLVVTACAPIEDRDYLENTTNVDGVELTASQSTAGGNKVTLDMTTPGVTGYWDYNLGQAFTNKTEFIYPIPGKNTFTFIGTLGAEFFEKTIDVQIDQLDNRLDQDWYDLVSEDTEAGKTWVFNGSGGDEGLWYFMSPNDDPSQWATAWWNAGGTCCPPADAGGKIKFDLNGAANLSHYSSPDTTPEVGSFVLNVKDQTLQVKGTQILGGNEQGNVPDALYTIISLTEDELILYVSNNGGGTGWTWVFKPEE